MSTYRVLGLLLVALGYCLIQTTFAQRNARDTLYLAKSKVPIPEIDSTISAVYLWAHPARHETTPSNKLRTGDWMRVNFSSCPREVEGISPKIESRFLYFQRLQKRQTYRFYYKGEGEFIGSTKPQFIQFLKLPSVIKGLLPYKIIVPIGEKELHEVYRWQHPNLYIVAYDEERKGYYRYRVVLASYQDFYHPKAFRIEE